MRRFSSFINSICFMVAFAGLGLDAHAYQSRYLVNTLGKIAESTDPSKVVGSFSVRNMSEQTVLIKIAPARDRNFLFQFEPADRLLRPGAETRVQFTGAIRVDGKFQIIAKIAILDEKAQQIGSDEVALYYLVQRRRLKPSTYEELYLRRDVKDKVLGDSFSSVEDRGQLKRGPEYKTPLPSVQRMIELAKDSILKIPTDSADPRECGPRGCPRRELVELPIEETQTPRDQLERGFLVSNVTGEFNFKGLDNLLHPAFGWRVKAWKNLPGVGWKVVAEDWVEYNGQWALAVNNGPGDVRFQYVAANRFFTPMTAAEDTYRWVGPIRTSLPSVFNEGSWFADTSNGNARGLGEMYTQGMYLWSKLYWEGEINPLRDKSIKVFFPNTTYDCGDGSGSPWSCASKDGRIWLIATHAIRNGVIQHELAHQINYEFWDSTLPPGTGGSHNLTNCYNRGLALTEGFANFMVFWTQSARGSDPNAGFDFRVEAPTACETTLATNESWVAASFWDLHDSRFDGSDNLWFVHGGAVPAIFLRQGMLPGMDDFHDIYRSKANAPHRTIIDGIFKQDKIID